MATHAIAKSVVKGEVSCPPGHSLPFLHGVALLDPPEAIQSEVANQPGQACKVLWASQNKLALEVIGWQATICKCLPSRTYTR